MKKIILLFVILGCAIFTSAQESELNKLADIVFSLKTGGENSYNSAINELASDKQWTQMDELGIDKNAECRASERTPGFKLNSVLTNAENVERYQTTTGNHLNGADSRYNYSLFEKTLKANKSVQYRLNERWGYQIFIIIPYSGKATATISSDGQEFTASALGNGAIKLTGNAVKGKPINVIVKNEGSENISYVIINYNSRK